MNRNNKVYKILEKSFIFLFYITIIALFLRGEVFRFHTKWISLTFTSVKNFVLVFILLWLLLRLWKGTPHPYPSPRGTPIISGSGEGRVRGLILLSWLVSTIFSRYPIVSFGAGWALLIYILWFYSIRDVMGEKRHLVNIIILMVGIAGFVNILNLYFHYAVGLGEILERYPFWPGKNALGLFLVMVLCMSGSLLYGRGWVWFGGINSILIILGIVFSYSRGAWISGLIACIGLVLYRFKRAIWLIIGCAILVLIISPSLVSERFGSIFKMEDVNIKHRLDVWSHAIKIVKDRPISGTGLGTFNEVFRDRYPDLFPPEGGESLPIQHAHNLYLQILVETGLLGLVIFAFFVIRGLLYSIRNFIREKDPFMKSIRYGSLLGIAVFFIYSITDCTTSWRFIGDSFSHINLIWLMLWVIALRPSAEG